MPFDIWLNFISASASTMQGAFDAMTRLSGAGPPEPALSEDAPTRWASHHSVLAELPTMRLLDFSTAPRGPGAIIVAPYALHTAQTADFALGHSVVEALQKGGLSRLVMTDWRRAREAQRYLSIDSCLADLNAVVDDFGAPAPLVGLCQGGLLAAIYAARFPEKVARLALVGAPLDTDASPSLICASLRHIPPLAIEALLARSGGILQGARMMAAWPGGHSPEPDIHATLQTKRTNAWLRQHFAQWHRDLIDLPGVFYQQTVDWIFRENRLAHGTFPALGRAVGLGGLRCPLFLLAASGDEVVSPAQVLAIRAKVATPQEEITTREVEGQHLSLFMGKRTLRAVWPEIAGFLAKAAA